ncbi:hypothetical protein CH63R_14480 [Colletotrichum higginsianum IMI 349063]|uniref:Uncharacterized protein n=1 Tax=Colletotrichum higginsianum (strain IMI 349063) TaxID=759273 RepID=A0A1B7XQZ5_COLHI|nr:hypothetical protein CH63R_14480 [Colletotrichum higginsianum IMI 349063]OBR02179.1 hypothetical protein CH63R_14480 [Colletotrichum higginsianum IMI 349063]
MGDLVNALFVSSPPGPSPISSPSLRPSQLLPDTLQGQYFDVDDDNDRENNTVDLPGAKAADPIQVEDGTSSTESYSGGE